MYPKVVTNLKKLVHNAKFLTSEAHNRGISIMGVSKVFSADSVIVKYLLKSNIDYLADSRIENLKKHSDALIEKVLLRIPMISEAFEVVKYSDISLNSEFCVIQKLDEEARKQNKIHKIILMIDFGDLREGVFFKDDLLGLIHAIMTLENVYLVGLGTNLTCYGGIIPNENIYTLIDETISYIESNVGKKFEIISGGNSSSVLMMLEDKLPGSITNLRLGESIVLGRETAYGNIIETMYDDVFILETEIIELKTKPSVPIGEIGMNAFGKKPIFKDIGNHKRAILAIGKQDVDYNELYPMDKDIEILGGSSDHIIINVENSKYDYKVGDIVKFKLTYGSILSLFTSKYVEKEYIEED